MKFWNPKKRGEEVTSIEFAPIFEGLHEFCPPKPMNQFVPGWFKKMSSRVGGVSDSEIPLQDQPLSYGKTIKSCPAIQDLFKVGYVIPAWCDFRIVVKEGFEFEWHSANPRYEIQFHSPQQLDSNSTRPGELNYVVKFIAPWRVQMPKGHLLLLKGLFYHTDLPFRVCEGIIDSSVTSTININTFWPSHPAEYLIKRGDPLAMILPFKKVAYQLKIHDDPKVGKRFDEKNKTLLFDSFENNYRKFTDRFLGNLFK